MVWSRTATYPDSMDRYEPPGEQAIREAQERGEFDDLPGAGKPLRDLGDLNDPDWWIKGFVEREKLDIGSVLPPALALRKEAEGFPESLADLASEAGVRTVLEDYNRRVKLDRLRPVTGRFPAPLARTVDVDDLVEQWRALRVERRRASEARSAAVGAVPPAREQRRRGRVGGILHRIAVWSGMAEWSR